MLYSSSLTLNTVMIPIRLIILLSSLGSLVSEDQYGFLTRCPGAENPAHITHAALSKYLFLTTQIHYPGYTYRKRFFYNRAIRGIGNDRNIDFKHRKTMLFLDGYFDATTFPPARVAIGNYAKKGYNTFSVDAQTLFLTTFPQTVRTSKQVGNATGYILNGLTKYGLRGADIELVGISLGGQTMAYVAKFFKLYSGTRIGRIVSLDPSGPCYKDFGPKDRLSPDDADLVQILHTGSEGYGNGQANGHLDFYFNGGETQTIVYPYQPWCDDFCSHVLSYAYFYTAFHKYPNSFVGIKCQNAQQAREHKCYDNVPVVTNVMGPKADPSKPGVYYIPVSAYAPFFAPKDFIEKKIIYSLLYNDALSDVDKFVVSF